MIFLMPIMHSFLSTYTYIFAISLGFDEGKELHAYTYIQFQAKSDINYLLRVTHFSVGLKDICIDSRICQTVPGIAVPSLNSMYPN